MIEEEFTSLSPDNLLPGDGPHQRVLHSRESSGNLKRIKPPVNGPFQGLLERSWLCGVLPVEILASHILSQFWVIVIQVLAAPLHLPHAALLLMKDRQY